MRTKNFLMHLFLGALLLTTGKVVGQSTTSGNVALFGTDFLGWNTNAANNFPLQVRHDLNQPIDWYTNAIQRMRLTPNVTSAMGPANVFPNVARNGYLLLSGQPDAFTNGNCRAPFTRLHLIDAVGAVDPVTYAQELGFRPWQRNGITFTGNSDQSYIGHRYAGDDNTDFVIQWSDNPNGSPWGVDRMKFVFTTQFNPGATRGAATTNGLEAIRLWPRNNLEVNVGIGDYAQPGAGDPTERVDMLDGRLRIRQLPDDPPANYLTKVLVVEDFPLFPWERGVVKWRDISTIIPPADCDWVLQSDVDPSFDPHVSSVYAGSSCVWGMAHGVGIGLQVPKAKLHVYHDEFSLLGRIGTWSRIVANDMQNPFRGVIGESGPEPQEDFVGHVEGVYGYAYNGKTTIGVRGYGLFNSSQQGAGSGLLVGVHGVAEVAQPYQSSFTAGVYGQVIAPQGTPQAWAGYFVGNVHATGNVTWASDQGLKTDVEEIGDATAVLQQLAPKRYRFRTEEFQRMSLPSGEHFGLIAQQVEEVLPQLVEQVVMPAETDSMGGEVYAAQDYKAVNYVELIPLLIAGFNEQQARIHALESQLAACCASPTVPADGKAAGSEQETLQGDARSLLISPNPFSEGTTLTYVLEREGRAQVLVNSADGKHLRSLFEGQRTAGEHRYEWSNADLSPGVYYVTLLFEGQPLVKKAVKVAR